MKKINVILIVLLLFVGTNIIAQSKAKSFNSNDYALFGEKFKVNKVVSSKDLLKKYKALKKGDSITVQFKSTIKSVCKK